MLDQTKKPVEKIVDGVKELSQTPIGKIAIPFVGGVLATIATQKITKYVNLRRYFSKTVL